MKEFDHVLPSNIVSKDYPNNTPSNFTTQFINPINLEGAWEVGVKSIFYASSIGNRDEKANVKLNYNGMKEELANNLYPVKYNLTKDQKWNYRVRHSNWKPKFPIPDSKSLVKAMNAMNPVISSNNNTLHFYLQGLKRLRYKTQHEGLSIRMSRQLTLALGYQWRVFLSMHSRALINSDLILSEIAKLKADDLSIKVFDRNVVKRKARILFKARGEAALSKDDFLNRWKEKIQPIFNARVDFKSDKVVISIMNDDAGAITFHPAMNHAIQHEEALFGQGEYWANYVYLHKRQRRFEDDEWIIDIYGDEMKTVQIPHRVEILLELYPRHYTLDQLMTFLSKTLTLKLQQNNAHGAVVFSLDKQFTKLQQPEEAVMELSSNLANILGFKTLVLKGNHHISNILPATLDQREQEIYIHTDITDRMNYGDGKRQMLQHFIHNKPHAYGIVEKFFNPIVYQPVVKNHINHIHIQLLGNYEQQLYIKDSKTIVTLHFRLIS